MKKFVVILFFLILTFSVVINANNKPIFASEKIFILKEIEFTPTYISKGKDCNSNYNNNLKINSIKIESENKNYLIFNEAKYCPKKRKTSFFPSENILIYSKNNEINFNYIFYINSSFKFGLKNEEVGVNNLPISVQGKIVLNSNSKQEYSACCLNAPSGGFSFNLTLKFELL